MEKGIKQKVPIPSCGSAHNMGLHVKKHMQMKSKKVKSPQQELAIIFLMNVVTVNDSIGSCRTSDLIYIPYMMPYEYTY